MTVLPGELEIRYKCVCMNKEAALSVPFRRDDEDVVQFMQTIVTPAIMLHHRRLSPLCASPKMEYAKVALPENAPFVGGKPVVM